MAKYHPCPEFINRTSQTRTSKNYRGTTQPIAKLTNYASTKRETGKRLVVIEAKYQNEKNETST